MKNLIIQSILILSIAHLATAGADKAAGGSGEILVKRAAESGAAGSKVEVIRYPPRELGHGQLVPSSQWPGAAPAKILYSKARRTGRAAGKAAMRLVPCGFRRPNVVDSDDVNDVASNGATEDRIENKENHETDNKETI